MMRRKDHTLLGVIVFLIVLVGIIYLAYVQEKDWQAFKEEHHCKEVGYERGQTITVVGTDGNLHTGSTSDKHKYVCDGGYEVVR